MARSAFGESHKGFYARSFYTLTPTFGEVIFPNRADRFVLWVSDTYLEDFGASANSPLCALTLSMAAYKIRAFLLQVAHWASARPDIQALALVGSYARHTETKTSDVDLVLITSNPDLYLKNTLWVEQFGTVTHQQVEPYGLLTSIRVWYDNGNEIEYGITDERWAAIPLDEGSRQVLSGGVEILFEQNRILSRHL